MMRPLLIAALLVVPAAMAVDAQWQEAPRDTEFQTTPGGMHATSRSADGVDRFEIDYDAASARLSYRFVDTIDQTTIEVEQRILAVIEWQDQDGDGRYTLADRTVHRTPIQGSTFRVTSEPTPDGDRAMIAYTLLGEPVETDPLSDPQSPTGQFLVTITVHGKTTVDGGRQVHPTTVPIDLSVVDHPFREEGTQVAFEVSLSTSDRIEHPGGERPLEVPEGNHSVFYAWNREAVVDGVASDTSVTEIMRSPRQPTGAIVYYAFPGGDATQGTRIGVLRQASILPDLGPIRFPEGDGALFAFGTLLMAGLVGVPAARRMRGSR